MNDQHDNQKSEIKFFNRSIFIILISIVIFCICWIEYQNRDRAQKNFDRIKELEKIAIKYNVQPFYTEKQLLIILEKQNELIKKHIDSLPFFITVGLLLLGYGIFLLINSRKNVKSIPQVVFIILENLLKLMILVSIFASLMGHNYHDSSFRFNDLTGFGQLLFCLMFPIIVVIIMIIIKKTYPTKILAENNYLLKFSSEIIILISVFSIISLLFYIIIFNDAFLLTGYHTFPELFDDLMSRKY